MALLLVLGAWWAVINYRVLESVGLRKTPAERVAMICATNRTVRLLIAGRLLTQYPDWDEARVQAEVARRMMRGAG